MTDSTPIPQSQPAPGTAAPDKFELHYRQQLSALIDGELPADEARFVLRRLQHDEELSGCHERWQLCGDILRGRVCMPAPADFGGRVRQALEAEAQRAGAAGGGRRRAWRWGGSAALAASVAAIALFVSRERLPEAVPAQGLQAATSAASAAAPAVPAALPRAPAPVPAADPQGGLVAAAPAVAIAAHRRQEAAVRRGATRTQQAARSSAATRAAEPARAVAAAAPALPLAATAAVPVAAPHATDPFAHQPVPPQARPWPRSALAPAASSGEFIASFPRQGAPAAFYPFEPRLPADAAPEPPLPQP